MLLEVMVGRGMEVDKGRVLKCSHPMPSVGFPPFL